MAEAAKLPSLPLVCLPAWLPACLRSLRFRFVSFPSRHRQTGSRSSSRRHGMPNSLTSHVACIVHPVFTSACTRLPVANAPIAARTNVTITNRQIPFLPSSTIKPAVTTRGAGHLFPHRGSGVPSSRWMLRQHPLVSGC